LKNGVTWSPVSVKVPSARTDEDEVDVAFGVKKSRFETYGTSPPK